MSLKRKSNASTHYSKISREIISNHGALYCRPPHVLIINRCNFSVNIVINWWKIISGAHCIDLCHVNHNTWISPQLPGWRKGKKRKGKSSPAEFPSHCRGAATPSGPWAAGQRRPSPWRGAGALRPTPSATNCRQAWERVSCCLATLYPTYHCTENISCLLSSFFE